MRISIPLEEGKLPDRFGKYSPMEYKRYGNTIHSFPFSIIDVPRETKSLAFTFVDYDSVPVCGFVWIHWLACNIHPETTSIPEGASLNGTIPWVQGTNSSYSRLEEMEDDLSAAQGYLGPCPPDKDHTYTLVVYALDCMLDLDQGYFLNDFHWAIEGHVIDKAESNIISRA